MVRVSKNIVSTKVLDGGRVDDDLVDVADAPAEKIDKSDSDSLMKLLV